MGLAITVYGGAGEVGGNKILLEDQDTRLFLDFGVAIPPRPSSQATAGPRVATTEWRTRPSTP